MSRFSRLKSLEQQLTILCSNARKKISQPYTQATIESKKEELTVILTAVNNLILTDINDKEYLEQCLSVKRQIKELKIVFLTLLDSHGDLLQSEEHSDLEKSTEVPGVEMAFEFTTGLKLPILSAEGDAVALRDFVDIVESYYDTLSAEGKLGLISFVCKNRIQGKAKTRLGDVSNINTFAALKTALLAKCGAKETMETLHNKLSNLRQGKLELTAYAEELELLAMKLANLQIKEQNIAVDAEKTAVHNILKGHALLTFKRGVHSELKTVIEAARPKNLEEALAVATTAQSNCVNPQIFHYRGNARGGNRGRGRWSNRRQPQGYYSNNANQGYYRNNANQGYYNQTNHNTNDNMNGNRQSQQNEQHSPRGYWNQRGQRGRGRGRGFAYAAYADAASGSHDNSLPAPAIKESSQSKN